LFIILQTMSSEQFIITFKDRATPEQIAQFTKKVTSEGGEVRASLTNINGLVAQLPGSFNIISLQGDDIIEAIEPDGIATVEPQEIDDLYMSSMD